MVYKKCPRASHNPLQSMFLFSPLNVLRLNIGFIIFESMSAMHIVISSRTPPAPRKTSLPYEMILAVIVAYFSVLVYCLKSKDVGAISTSSVKLIQPDKVNDPIPKPQPPILLRQLLRHFLPPSIRHLLSPLAPSLSRLPFSPLLSLPLIIWSSTPLHLKVRLFLPTMISHHFQSNRLFFWPSVHSLPSLLTQPTFAANSPSFIVPFITLTSPPLPKRASHLARPTSLSAESAHPLNKRSNFISSRPFFQQPPPPP